MHSDGKKRRSFLTLLFAAGELQRWAANDKQEEDWKIKMQLKNIKKKRKAFGWIFLISIFIFVLISLYLNYDLEPNATPPPNNGPSVPIPEPTKSSSKNLVIVSVISLLTSLTSLVGFVSTTVLAWRKEKRETLMLNLEMQKKELEIERMRFELNDSKAKTQKEN